MIRKKAKIKMPQSKISDFDITKSMLKTIDQMKRSLVKESSEDYEELSGGELKAEQDKFVDIVSPRVIFGKLMIYPKDNNVKWEGKFTNGIIWMMDKNGGLTIEAQGVKVDDEEMEMISKLKKYHEVWVDEWSNKLRNDYKISM